MSPKPDFIIITNKEQRDNTFRQMYYLIYHLQSPGIRNLQLKTSTLYSLILFKWIITNGLLSEDL